MKRKRILGRIVAFWLIACLFITNTGIEPFKAEAKPNSDVKRYNVLVLDYSDTADFLDNGVQFYTAGTPIKYVQAAAKKFIEDMRDAEGKNYVAIVTYNASATQLSGFSDNYDELLQKIDNLKNPTQDVRDISAGLEKAKELLSQISGSGIRKNVILLSTGMTNTGKYNYTGHYSEATIASQWHNLQTGVHLYAYANNAYTCAKELDSMGVDVYSAGVFQTMTNIPDVGKDIAQFFKITAEELASNPKYFFSADNPDELEFVFGEVVEAIGQDKISGAFSYLSGDSDYTAKFYFNTDYFASDASNFNQSLATMSLCLAMSAFGTQSHGGYDTQYMNAYNLLRDIGFDEDTIKTNKYFTEKPHEDTMGVIVGQRPITVNDEEYVLLAVATRGGGYESEWAGNFTLGSFGNHEGFTAAADEVKRFLDEYINQFPDLKNKKVKLWITGFSRAAATANIVAGDLTRDGGISGMNLEKENIYAYCFEPPMGLNVSEVSSSVIQSYTNIHNIVNPDDLVPRVAMKVWGFTRYGKDENIIPAITTISDKSKYDSMMEFYKNLDNPAVWSTIENDKHVLTNFQAKHIKPAIKAEWPSISGHWEKKQIGLLSFYYYSIDDFDMGSIEAQMWENSNKSMSAFQDDLLTDMCLGFQNRILYSELVEPSVRVLLSIMKGGEPEKCSHAVDYFTEKIRDNALDIACIYISSGCAGVSPLITTYFIDSCMKAGIEIRGYLESGVALSEALDSVVRAICAALITSGGDDFITLCYNAGDIFTAHYPELILAWMMSQDPNYTGDAGDSFVPVTRIIHINCPVDVKVYDITGKLVAAIYNNVPENIEDSLIQAFYTSDGEKQIYLPADAEYHVEIIATGDGKLNYCVDEYSYETYTHVKTVNYYDIPITTGDNLVATVPACNIDEEYNTADGLPVNYVLSKGQEIPANDIRVGVNAEENTFYVSAVSNNKEAGSVSGSGNHVLGSFAQVTANPFDGCTFNGWYLDGQLVSSDNTYRFRVENNVTLEADFSGMLATPENGAYEVKFIENDKGDILEGKDGWYAAGSRIKVHAEPADGYKFSHWTTSGSGYFEAITSNTTIFNAGAANTEITAVFAPIDEACSHSNIEGGEYIENTCTADGSISAIVCEDCNKTLQEEVTIKAKGHRFYNGKCVDCGKKEKSSNKDKYDNDAEETTWNKGLVIGIASGAVALLAIIVAVIVIIHKKRRK